MDPTTSDEDMKVSKMSFFMGYVLLLVNQNLLYDARCCKEWGLVLKKWNAYAKCSQKLLELSVTKFSTRFLKFPDSLVGSRMDALFEAIVIAVDHGELLLLGYLHGMHAMCVHSKNGQ